MLGSIPPPTVCISRRAAAKAGKRVLVLDSHGVYGGSMVSLNFRELQNFIAEGKFNLFISVDNPMVVNGRVLHFE